MKPRIGITLGDYNGIGPEIALKSALHPSVRTSCRPILIGAVEVIHHYARRCGLKVQCGEFDPSVVSWKFPFVPILSIPASPAMVISPGEARREAGTFAGKVIEASIDAWKRNVIDGLVTAPTSKEVMYRAGYSSPGQTELIAQLTRTSRFGMMLIAGSFRVGLATVHVPLRDVARHLSKKIIVERLRLIDHSLRTDFRVARPNIAVLGLNPHAGEGGLLGKEELRIIQPALRAIRKNHIHAEGPFPADGFFAIHAYKKYDAVLAMYHDQGLIPLKMLGFQRGVNYSMGLPIVRTSPDHGTAFALAGKNVADPSSMIAAITTAAQIIRNRKRTG